MLCSPTDVVNWVGREVQQSALVLQETFIRIIISVQA